MSKVTQQVNGTGKLPLFPSPSLFQCPGGCLAGDADPGTPSLPPLAIAGYTPSVAGWEPPSGSRLCGEQHACIPRQAGTFLLGSHCATRPAPPAPLHTEPLSAPDTLSSRCPPAANTAPRPPLPGGVPGAEHPCPSPKPQRAATPPILEPSRDQRVEMTCPKSQRPKSKSLDSLLKLLFLKNASSPLYLHSWAAGHPSSGSALVWPLTTPPRV